MNNFISNFFLIRTPLKPIKDLYSLFSDLKENNDADLYYVMQRYFTDERFLEAIYIASPVLYYEFKKLLNSPHKFISTDKTKLFSSLLKYYIRSCTRCTPFGAFASCSMGRFSSNNLCNFQIEKDFRRNLRLDMEFLYNLSSIILKNENYVEKFKYRKNSSLYFLKSKARYVEFRFDDSNIRRHYIVEIETNSVLRAVIRTTKDSKYFNDILSELINETDYEREDIRSYLIELINSQVLVPEISPNVAGEDYFLRIVRIINDIEKDSNNKFGYSRLLNSISKKINIINKTPIKVEQYESLEKDLQELGIKYNPGHLFQLDCFRESNTFIAESLVNNIKEISLIIMKMSMSNNKYNSNLEVFKRAFYEKYEDQLVKLTNVIDPEFGIGYTEDKGIVDYYDKNIDTSGHFKFLLQRKMRDFYKNGKNIELNDDDFKGFSNLNADKIPNAFTAMLEIHAIDDQHIFYLTGITNSSSSLIGRFCHLDDDLKNSTISLLKEEDELYSNSIVAEICSLPQSRVGNVIARPRLRNFEIEYLSHSTLSKENRINIDDLYLKLEKGNLILYSKSLKKRIIPKLSSAHNFSGSSLSIYRFLGDLQHQNVIYTPIWDWKEFSNEFYLPRVMYKNAILSKAKWRIAEPIFQKADSIDRFKTKFRELCIKYDIPKYLIYSNHDNTLLLDIETDECLNIIFKVYRQNNYSIVLSEALQNKKDPVVSDSDNELYANEIFIPFIKKNEGINVSNPNIKIADKIGLRKFYPGSEWIFFKLYLNPDFFDKILLKLQKVINKEFDDFTNKWFFIRYSDPKPHLRIRFLLKDINMTGVVLNKFAKVFRRDLEQGVIKSLLIDTYNREIERYGRKTMELSESVFHITSLIALDIINKDLKSTLNREDITFLLINFLATLFYVDINKRYKFYEDINSYFKNEFAFDRNKKMKSNFQNNFRENSAKWSELINGDIKYFFIQNKLQIRNLSKLEGVIVNVLSIVNDEVFKKNLLTSYIHMLVNRTFSNYQRYEEFKLYYNLNRTLKSYLARKNNK